MPQMIEDPILPPPIPAPSSVASNGLSNGHATNGFGGAAEGLLGDSNGAVVRRDAMDYEDDDGASLVVRKPLWEGSSIDRREFVRLALQAFKEMGYT